MFLQCILRDEGTVRADLPNKKPLLMTHEDWKKKMQLTALFVINVSLRIFSRTLFLCLTKPMVVISAKAIKMLLGSHLKNKLHWPIKKTKSKRSNRPMDRKQPRNMSGKLHFILTGMSKIHRYCEFLPE